MLAASFNAMADSVQAQARLDESRADLAAVMLREDELHAFCRELLKALTERTGSQVGAVYFANADRTAFEHFESIGLGTGAGGVLGGRSEGELGVALATRQMQHVVDIPADSRFTFVTVSGEFKPREILTIPVLADEDVTAVISLASIRPYADEEVKLVRDIHDVYGGRRRARLSRVQGSPGSRRTTSRPRCERRELALQGDELTEQNTELEMQKRELDEANRLKSVFLSSMSHELRTPLNSVIALSGVLDRRLKGIIPDEEYGYLEVIERNGRNLLALINDILDLSRIESGREELVVSRFSLADLVGEIAETFEQPAHENRVELVRSLPGDLPEITSDLVKCRHILQNLVGNAVKFTEGGSVADLGPAGGRRGLVASPTPGGIAAAGSRSSRSSARPTRAPRAGPAAPGWASPSPGGTPSCWVAASRWRASWARAAPSPGVYRWCWTCRAGGARACRGACCVRGPGQRPRRSGPTHPARRGQ